MSQLRLIRASAGSGKTFTITAAYLQLLFKYPGNFRNILAVTFTNKATAEMKTRILSELYKLSQGLKSDHAVNLIKEFKFSENDIQKKAQEILDTILHNYSRFSVNTIDSFFQGIIRSFAREAGIQFNYDVALDTNEVLEQAADLLMLHLENDKTLLQWMSDFSERRIEEGKSWDFRKNLVKLGKEIFNEQFMAFPKEFHENIANREFLKNLYDEINLTKIDFEKYLTTCGVEGLKIMKKHGLQPFDFKFGKVGSVGSYIVRLANGRIEAPSNRIISASEDVQNWLPKEKDIAARITMAADDGLLKLLIDSVEYFQTHFKNYESSRVVLKNFYTLGILADLKHAIDENSINDNVFVLANSGPFLKAIIGENDTPFIYEKTGQTYKHFMIDEFQDTSGIQWENFKPLISDSLAADNYSMLVGDVKQSIYRWRNTDWKIMASQVGKDLAHFGLKYENLQFNWRSNPNIIAFNNTLFHLAPTHLKEILSNEIPEENIDDEFRNFLLQLPEIAYNAAIQDIPEKNQAKTGQIDVRFFENSEIDFYEKSLATLPEIIENLCKNGSKLKDIAILVRKAKEGRMVFDYLNEYKLGLEKDYPYRFDVLSNESAYVASSPAVQLLLKTFRYLVFPEDKLNFCALLNDYTTLFPGRSICGIPLLGMENGFVNSINDENFVAAFSKKMNPLKALPPNSLLEHLLELYELNQHQSHLPFIQAFHDCVSQFTFNNSPSLSAFLDFWEENNKNLSVSISEEQDAMRIVSIHKSKGLEYKNVIIPFCNWEFDHRSMLAPILWCASDVAPFNKLSAIPVEYSSKLKGTVFANSYYIERVQFMVDNLNLLYVALTRAENNLFIMAPEPLKPEKITSVSNLLFKLLSAPDSISQGFPHINFSEAWNIDKKCFLYGKLENIIKPENQADDKISLIPLESYPSHSVSERLRQRTVSPFFSKSQKMSSNRTYGNFMHRLFQELRTIDDILPAIKKLNQQGLLPSEDMQHLQTEIETLLKQDPYKGWFSSQWKVLNEAGIIVPQSPQYRPDRVMINADQTIVIDYKFGINEKDSYLLQVKDYMNCLETMDIKNVEGYVWYISINKHVKVEKI